MITRLIKQPLYDTEVVPERIHSVDFFRVPLSQQMQFDKDSVKGEEHTNLNQSGQLDLPLKFYLKGIHVFDESYCLKRIDRLIQRAPDKETEAALLLERKSFDPVEHEYFDKMDSEQFSSGSFTFGFNGRRPLFKGPISSLSRSRKQFEDMCAVVSDEKKQGYTKIESGEAFSFAFRWSSGLHLHHPRYVQVFLEGYLENAL
jgi:hypothetical protein